MRSAAIIVALTACSTDASTPKPITVDAPAFTLQPGEEKLYCYYTTLPTTEPTGFSRITSSMTPGSHHMIVFEARQPKRPDGTFEECTGFGIESPDGGIPDIPAWLYASQEPEQHLDMPEGVGLASIAAQPILINMHYVNTTDAPIEAHVHVELEPIARGAAYTEAHTYFTFATEIDVPAGATGSAGGSCDVSPDAKFIELSTHSHRYTTSAHVTDGTTPVLETLDWEHATVNRWDAPYFSFQSGKLDYRCDYDNTTSAPLTMGESAVSNEMCMAVGVFFPATNDVLCLNSTPLQL